jgi:diguanylate cyclase (GGDEF)-like protein
MEKPFVLIIEDERDIAALFRHVLDMAGYRTEIAAHGTLAAERLSHCQPDIVLLDLTLPGTSGAEILRKMRADERLKGVPVVVITAHSEIAESLAVEPDLVMLKPVSAAQLTGLVQRLTRESKLLEAAPFGKAPSDKITGLYNRSFFMNRLDYAFRSLKENGQNLFAVLSLSPNQYEGINHRFGKQQADAFLSEAAELLRASVRPTDTIARFEQDQFHILVEQAPRRDIADMIAARIQVNMNGRVAEATGERFSCCIGVLLCDRRYEYVDEIERDARAAYALAKAGGPGTCLIFDHDSIKKNRPIETAG